MATKDVMQRFLDKVSIEPNSGCWLWTASTDTFGYGQMYVDEQGKPKKAHRVAWQLFRGAIPAGMCVCHAHDDAWCVNPEHLFLGTHKDNSDDKIRKGRHGNQRKTHCKQGHAFDAANLDAWSLKHGKRICKTCETLRGKARWAKELARRNNTPTRKAAQ